MALKEAVFFGDDDFARVGGERALLKLKKHDVSLFNCKYPYEN